jgi:hypothetical protein
MRVLAKLSAALVLVVISSLITLKIHDANDQARDIVRIHGAEKANTCIFPAEKADTCILPAISVEEASQILYFQHHKNDTGPTLEIPTTK